MKTITSKNKQSTREIILHAIKTSSQANIEKLAEVADVSPVTVRHHINTLQAAGLIESESIRRKVGRPYYVYSLSEKGQELFPKRYIRLTTRLLDELKARLPEEVVQEVFNSVVQGVLDDHEGEYEHLPFENKLDYLVGLLGDEGFTSTWERSELGYILREHSCPYISIGQHHNEICTIDTELIINVLQAPIKQHSCLLQGADCCEFVIAEEHSV
ncbi:MAG: DeoR family transcriptional regulator [Anaerolineales bacterium]|nr:DeoR family transcriptional regulator [Anaerolineales bacterium]